MGSGHGVQGVRISEKVQSARGMACKAVGHCLAARGREARLPAHAQNLCSVPVCNDQTGAFGQQIHIKICIHGPEKAVGLFKIAAPFAVGHEIGAA